MNKRIADPERLSYFLERDHCDMCNAAITRIDLNFWGDFGLCEPCDKLMNDRYVTYMKKEQQNGADATER